MSQSSPERFSIRHALGLSTVMHALIAPLFLVSSVTFAGVGQSSEPLGFRGGAMAAITTLTIEHRAHTPKRAAAEQPVRAANRAAVKHARPIRKRSVTVAVDTPAQAPVRSVARPGRSAEATGSAVMSIVRSTVVTQPAEAATLAPKPETSPAAAATTAPAPSQPVAAVAMTNAAQAATGRGYDSPNGGWGQNFERPLVVDETALGELRSKYHLSATITVSVDENGRATKITFPNSVPADVRPEIERRLTAIRYAPAECNGLRCPAALAITI